MQDPLLLGGGRTFVDSSGLLHLYRLRIVLDAPIDEAANVKRYRLFDPEAADTQLGILSVKPGKGGEGERGRGHPVLCLRRSGTQMEFFVCLGRHFAKNFSF